MKIILYLFVVSLFFFSHVNAQTGRISGKITEAGTGKPLSNAQVKISALRISAATDLDGNFEIRNVPYGKYTLSLSGENLEDKELAIELNSETLMLPVVEMKRKAGETEGISEISTVILDQEDENKEQNVSGLLHSSEDVFTSTAGYIFGSISFRPRGYDNENNSVLINGTDVSDPENGRVSFTDWGGLNDAMRNKEVFTYTSPNPYAFGSIGGLTNINTMASAHRKELKISYSLTNRTYRDRLMVTYATGLMKNGWAFTLSASRRWSQEGYVEGTFYDATGYFLSVEKRLGKKHSLGLTAFYAPTKRGSQSATVQEAYDLSGTNYYNPNWGYQDGTKRNARVKKNNEPEFILTHIWNINDKTKLRTSLNYTCGTNAWTSLNWYNAPDPRPDYYRYLPSYQTQPEVADLATEQWQNNVNVRQINWDHLIQMNYMSNMFGEQARYIVESNVTKTRQFSFNTNIDREINSHVDINGGLNFKLYHAEHYKILDDLLGGNYWINIDQFNERDFPGDSASAQNDLNHPNQVIYKGDKFGYNYVMHVNTMNLWGLGKFSYNKLDFYLGAALTGTEFWRTGNYRNGRHPNNSYGDSKKYEFLNPEIKGGITYKITGRHYLVATGFFETRAPYITTTFISPKTRNDVVPNPVSEIIFGGDASYIVRYPWLNARVTYYYTRFRDESKIVSFYADDLQTYINYIMTGIDKMHEGIEVGAEVKATKFLSIIAVAAVGNHIFTSRPKTTLAYDNGLNPDTTFTTYLKNFYVAGSPQTALSGGIKLNYKYWFLDINANYYDNAWLDINPERRTTQAISGLKPSDLELIKTITGESQMQGGFTLDASIGKSIRINYKYFININLSVNNILNNTSVQSWGYEQNRFDFTTKDLTKFPSKFLYYYGRNYFLNVSFRM